MDNYTSYQFLSSCAKNNQNHIYQTLKLPFTKDYLDFWHHQPAFIRTFSRSRPNLHPRATSGIAGTLPLQLGDLWWRSRRPEKTDCWIWLDVRQVGMVQDKLFWHCLYMFTTHWDWDNVFIVIREITYDIRYIDVYRNGTILLHW